MIKISITYCAVWHYAPRATSLVAELLENFEPDLESVTLIPSDGGRFEVKVEDNLIYSKLQTKRHAEKGEVVGLVQKFIEERG